VSGILVEIHPTIKVTDSESNFTKVITIEVADLFFRESEDPGKELGDWVAEAIRNKFGRGVKADGERAEQDY
jgi:hypothetical protein